MRFYKGQEAQEKKHIRKGAIWIDLEDLGGADSPLLDILRASILSKSSLFLDYFLFNGIPD